MLRKSYSDEQLLASDFEVGDSVRLIDPVKGKQTAYVGRVTSVLTSIGFVDVEFPHGNMRLSPADLAHADDARSPSKSTDLDTWERRNATAVASAHHFRLGELLDVAANFRTAGVSQMDAYDMLFVRFGSSVSDDDLKHVVTAAYGKQALYWKQKGRQYVPTKGELSSGCFNCPKCSTELEPATYKKHTKLMACRECLFLIKRSDILDSLDVDERSEVEKSLGWDVRDPSKSFDDWR